MQTSRANTSGFERPRRYGHRRSRMTLTWGIAIGIALVISTHAVAQEHTWLDQFGTSGSERATAVAAGADLFYAAGYIDYGALDETTSHGGADAILRCYNASGNVMWTRQFGTPTTDRAYAALALDDGCVVVGSTYGSLDGANSGASDAFVQRRDANGSVKWTTQFGTTGVDELVAIATDGSSIFVAGWTDGTLPAAGDDQGKGSPEPSRVASTGMDALLARLDMDGALIWKTQFGTSGFDKAYAIAVANGALYVTGRVGAALAGQTYFGSADVFVICYDFDGNETWSRQFGTSSSDVAFALAGDANGVYVAGSTPATLPGQSSFGRRDGFVRCYQHDGTEMWTRQLGGTGSDDPSGVALDASGVYITGETEYGLAGQPPSSGPDAFMMKLDHAGVELWVDQLGSPSSDEYAAISVSPMGAYVAGSTFGAMPGEEAMGSRDAIVVRYDVPAVPDPEPEAVAMTLDVKPGECPKSINVQWMNNRNNGNREKPNMGGVLPVALAVSADFDLDQVDPASCRLEGVEPLRWSYEDVSSPGSSACDCEESQPDGVVDLTMKFNKQDVIEALIARGAMDAGGMKLTGTLWDGTSIEAVSCVELRHGDDLLVASAHPNPFNPTTTIVYSITREMPVTVSIYDITGRLVARLIEETQAPGDHRVEWPADGFASGVYFYQVRAGELVAGGRVTMIK